ncbi:MAG: hypothetical protein LKG11_00690 [Bacilli bacterium]|nr:hypothetical protein [Bacilli bacterium]
MKAKFKAPKNKGKIALGTIAIVTGAATVAICGIAGYYIATTGWDAVLAWFQGKWFAMIAVILIIAAFLVCMICMAYSTFKKTRYDDNE